MGTMVRDFFELPVHYASKAVGVESSRDERHRLKAEGKARAEADAAVKQAEFEASSKAGLERLALKRKKGFGASMIVNPVLGSSSTLGS